MKPFVFMPPGLEPATVAIRAYAFYHVYITTTTCKLLTCSSPVRVIFGFTFLCNKSYFPLGCVNKHIDGFLKLWPISKTPNLLGTKSTNFLVTAVSRYAYKKLCSLFTTYVKILATKTLMTKATAKELKTTTKNDYKVKNLLKLFQTKYN